MSRDLPPIHARADGDQAEVTITNLRCSCWGGTQTVSLSIEDTRELIGQLIGVVEDHYAKAGKR